MRDVERYLNVRSAYGASFSPDGTLAFLMDTTGTPQVWTLESPVAWPDQRTFFDERVTFCDFSPAREELAFGMDHGGDERQQLFRLDADGSITNWTAMPGSKHRWGGWSSDGDRFAFASNRRDESVFDLYVQGRDESGDDARRLHEGDGWLSVTGWSPDDATVAVHEARSDFDHDVHVLDVASGELTHLTPHDGDVRYQSLSWGPDGSLYLVTDEGRDLLALSRLDRDGDSEQLVRDPDWNVDGVAVDEDSGGLVYSRNVDGYTELTVGELTDDGFIRTFPDPSLPGGIAGGVSFGPDAERFAVTATGDTHNANVHVVETTTGESHRWTDAATAGISRDTFRASNLVRYETFDGREIPAFFTLPAEAEAAVEGETPAEGSNSAEEEAPVDGEAPGEGETPVVVEVHGGPASQRRPSFSGLKQYFLANGYAFFEPNVRGSTGYGTAYTHLDDVEKRMDSVADVKAGVEWLHDHPAIDADRVVIMGGSYGGFVVLASLTEYPDLWAAGVDVVGIASFVTFLENTGSWRRSLREAEYGSLDEDREFLESISPVNRADRIRAPLFVLHGANDPRVPVGEAEQIAEAASEHVPVETLIFEDEGHGIAKLENRVEAYSRVVEFLDEHV